MCRDMQCKDDRHIISIDLFFSDICNAFANSSAHCIYVSGIGSTKDFIIPWFNEHVKTSPEVVIKILFVII